MEKFYETFDKWLNINYDLRKECVNYIVKTLEQIPNKVIDFDDEGIAGVFVSYDGGNHPEYASNVYSRVESVFLKGEDTYLNTEDCTEYHINNISAEETYYVAEYLQRYVEKNIDIED